MGLTNWEERFEELRDYRKKFGNCNVPARYQHNKQLGSWVSWQRVQYKKIQKGENSTMTRERIAKLDSIDFTWVVGSGGGQDGLTADELWEKRFNELKDYRKKNGNCNVPFHYQDNKQLGRWVNKQRTHYKKFQKGENPQIIKERISKLKSIGFVWDTRIRVDDCEGGGLTNNGNRKRLRDDSGCSSLEGRQNKILASASQQQKTPTRLPSPQRLESKNSTIDDEDDDHAAETIAIFMEAYDPLPKNPRFQKG